MRNQNAAFGIRAASVKSVFCAAVHAVKHLVADLGKVPDNHRAGLYLAITEELDLQAVADAVEALFRDADRRREIIRNLQPSDFAMLSEADKLLSIIP